jgi:hypothetical protein
MLENENLNEAEKPQLNIGAVQHNLDFKRVCLRCWKFGSSQNNDR